MPAARPSLLTIGAHHLRTTQAAVTHSTTLLHAYAQALRLLDGARPSRPTLILLDLHAQEPGFPEFAAPQLAAVLARQMITGKLHPAWLIGLAADPTPDLDLEAHVAGCHLLLPPPISESQQRGLLRLAQTPALLLPTADRATIAYGLAAERVLLAVQAAQIPLWTADEVILVLRFLTAYPLPRNAKERPGDQARTTRLLRALGGSRQARQRLHQIANAWRTRFPLYSEILWQFLDGWERKEIVSYFVSRHLYEDSRIYTCISELPERIAQELRLAQTKEGA